jgi:hypothetical protein
MRYRYNLLNDGGIPALFQMEYRANMRKSKAEPTPLVGSIISTLYVPQFEEVLGLRGICYKSDFEPIVQIRLCLELALCLIEHHGLPPSHSTVMD